MAIIYEALLTVVQTRQKEHELLQDYTKRFRVVQEVFESHVSDSGGPINLKKIIKKMTGYDESNTKKIEEQNKTANDQLMAYIYLANADRSKYGGLFKGLNTQYSLGNNQFPKTISEASDVLSSYKPDNSYKDKNDKDKSDKKKETNDKEKEADSQSEELRLSFAQMEGRCYCCGQKGHYSHKCRQRDKPKEEWAIHQSDAQEEEDKPEAQQHVQLQQDSEDKAEGHKFTSWIGAHFDMSKIDPEMKQLKNLMLLDSQAPGHIFGKKEYLDDIRSSGNQTLTVSTLKEKLFLNHIGDVPDNLGTAWYSDEVKTNIFSLAELSKRFRITYDSSKEDAIIVHHPKKKIKFVKNHMNLYVYDPGKVGRSGYKSKNKSRKSCNTVS
ncbi:hypothetical protein IV203_032970 [Nitzschia inconspicua]|uniref:CCHC-type domain-containing protein n=1 Tax=Nitzschia inconspicua TaxID=303405 RepID=A0A9K3KKJ0_9STRA|nr:hypothetical protein IV203_032970 [Nitzschia inconspicua]